LLIRTLYASLIDRMKNELSLAKKPS